MNKKREWGCCPSLALPFLTGRSGGSPNTVLFDEPRNDARDR